MYVIFHLEATPTVYIILSNKLSISAGQDLISYFSYIIEPTTVKDIKAVFNENLIVW